MTVRLRKGQALALWCYGGLSDDLSFCYLFIQLHHMLSQGMLIAIYMQLASSSPFLTLLYVGHAALHVGVPNLQV